jgi:hypothetical protein
MTELPWKKIHPPNEQHKAIKLMDSGLSTSAVAARFNVQRRDISVKSTTQKQAKIINNIKNQVPGEMRRKCQKTRIRH